MLFNRQIVKRSAQFYWLSLSHSILAPVILAKVVVATVVVAAITVAPVAVAATALSTIVASEIEGHPPYFDSIGSRIVQGGIEQAGSLKIAVGTQLEVPSYLSLDEPDSAFYRFRDKDNDPSALKGIGNLPNGSAGTKTVPIEWYVIKAKTGFRFADEPAEKGELITAWQDDQIETLQALTGFYRPQNSNSFTVIIPESALGYRIGFKALPTSEYGVPDTGRWLTAWDLNFFYQQNPVLEPGAIDPDDCSVIGDCGQPTDPNLQGGGGVVALPDYAITIYDQSTDMPVTDQAKLKVNHTYFATIRIKDAASQRLREPNQVELASLKWNIVSAPDKENIKIVASYDRNSERFINKSDNPSTELAVNGDRYVKYFFSTQLNNLDADAVLQSLPPNFSEQGFGLQVAIEY